MSSPMAFPSVLLSLPLLSLLLSLSLLSLLLGLLLALVLMIVLLAESPPNRQGILINGQFDIFRSNPREGNIHLVTVIRLTDVHRCNQRL